jgi:membrane-bound serine protease (ClpP class)
MKRILAGLRAGGLITGMVRCATVSAALLLGAALVAEGEPEPQLPDDVTQPVTDVDVPPSVVPPVDLAEETVDDTEAVVMVIPVTEQISKANLFILRRGLKQAIAEGATAVLLDMDTPGGRLDVTLEMMELLERFEGTTLTFVNKDAISAGAFISMATQHIYFAPNGVMGAAAVVSGGGQEIDESMKAKINSYLLARMRSYTGEFRYRADVIRAMADLDFVLEIDEQVLKDEGELLSLTAKEATALFGDPPVPLLADGIAEDVEAALQEHYGDRPFSIIRLETTWSEGLAKYLTAIAPVLLGLGFLALFVEFKTPGFGIAGISGLLLISIVFASNYIAGLAGLEALLFFILGLAFVAIEILLLPGTLIFLAIGVVLIFGSLFWSLADIWPAPNGDDSAPGLPFTVDPDAVWLAAYQILGGLALAIFGLLLVWRFLPKTSAYSRIVLSGASGSPDLVTAGGSQVAGSVAALPDLGSEGTVIRDLHPLGEIEIAGKRYQATVATGSLSRGERVVVTGYRNFSLLVDKR